MSICCSLPEIINSVGLACDIVGVGLLYRFGLSEQLNTPGGTVIVYPGENSEDAEKRMRSTRWSRCGLFLVIVGFALQIVSNCL